MSLVYVSNAADGDISMFRMESGGTLHSLGRAAAGPMVMPLAASPGKRHLYAAVRSQPFRVVTYAIDAGSGRLAQVGNAPLADSMAYIATDRSGRWLFGASYGGDVVTVNAIGDDGVAAGPVQVVKTGRHAHCVLAHASNRFVYATNLGADRVLQFAFDAGSGTLAAIGEGSVEAPKGSGPRHIAFSPDGATLYALGELSGTVTRYRIDSASGALTLLDSAQAVPGSLNLLPGVVRGPHTVLDDKPRIWASDIRVTPDGRFVHVAERTTSTICVLREGAALTPCGHFEVERQPRGFHVEPGGRFMIVTGEKSREIGVYAIHPESGALAPHSKHPGGQGANWVEIVAMP